MTVNFSLSITWYIWLIECRDRHDDEGEEEEDDDDDNHMEDNGTESSTCKCRVCYTGSCYPKHFQFFSLVPCQYHVTAFVHVAYISLKNILLFHFFFQLKKIDFIPDWPRAPMQ